MRENLLLGSTRLLQYSGLPALLGLPPAVLLDEPSLGLAPIIVKQIYDVIAGFAWRSGATVIISGQMAAIALKGARRRVALAGSSAELLPATYL